MHPAGTGCLRYLTCTPPESSSPPPCGPHSTAACFLQSWSEGAACATLVTIADYPTKMRAATPSHRGLCVHLPPIRTPTEALSSSATFMAGSRSRNDRRHGSAAALRRPEGGSLDTDYCTKGKSAVILLGVGCSRKGMVLEKAHEGKMLALQ